MTRPVAVLVAVVAAAAWVVVAWLLLPSVVPDGLQLPPVDVDAVFGAEVVDRAEDYERLYLVLWPLSVVALLATLWLYAKRGAAFARESAGGPIATGMLLGMLGLACVWLSQLPFDLVSFWWARRHDLFEGGYLEWAFGSYFELGATFLWICLAILIVMGLARWLGDRWWLPAAVAVAAIGALLTFASPYLIELDTEPLSAELRSTAETFERRQGVDGITYREEVVSDQTPLANAYAIGFGPSKLVVLWDTLLDGRFSDGAVDVVLAHEIGHHSGKHLLKGIAWFALFALPCAWVLMRLTRRRGGMARAEAVPLALLVVAVLQLALAPAQAWVSRRMEAEADWKALQTTRDPRGARELFVGFASTSLGDPSPPAWSQAFLGSHPTLEDRVAMADAWAARTSGADAP
ncbi:MAG TPA: M48 family metalloprotease [Gaiellaceae bacterium]|jgi:STE24 endopeptidase